MMANLQPAYSVAIALDFDFKAIKLHFIIIKKENSAIAKDLDF